MSLYNAYRPKTLAEMYGNEAVVKAVREHFAQPNPKRISHCHIISGESGCGKAQPLYSKVLTPTGWKRMGDIKVGDTVISGDGEPTTVLAVYPQGLRPVYTISLDDKTAFHVADNHLNVVTYKKYYNKHKGKVNRTSHTEVLTTEQLINLVDKANGRSATTYIGGIRIPNIKVKGKESTLPINPYLLGILIGDGTLSASFSVSLPEEDVYNNVFNLLKDEGFTLHKISDDPTNYDYHIVRDVESYPRSQDMINDTDNLKNKIKKLNLNVKSVNKHIPQEYLYASEKDRLELLRGLFDSDGHVGKNVSKKGYVGCYYEYTTSSEELSRDFEILVRSLGISDTVTSKIPQYRDSTGNIIKCHVCYRHHLKVPNNLRIASSNKHINRIKDRQCGTLLSRRITSITYKGLEECQCIYVEADCHTYVTDNHTLTHNTTLARIIATELLGSDPTFGIHEINTADNRGIDTVRDIIDQMRGLPLKGRSVSFVVDEAHGLTADAKRAFLKPTEDMPAHVYFFFCTTNLTQLLKGDEGKALGTRSTQWKMEPLNARQLGKLILNTAEKENFNVDDTVLTAIIEAAEGSPRAALVALEKIMGVPDDIDAQIKILESACVEADPNTLEFCRTVCANKPNWEEINAVLREMKGKVDAETVRRGVLGYCTSIMLKNGSERICRVMEEFAIPTYDTGFPGLVLAAYRSMK